MSRFLLRSVAGCLALLLLMVGGARAQGHSEEAAEAVESGGDSSSEGALFLLLPVGAQGVAMGRAMSALSTQEAAFWNPAGLADLGQGRVFIYRGDQLAGESTVLSVLLSQESIGTVGLSYQLLDSGDQDLRDEQGNVLGTLSVRSHVAMASFATTLLSRLYAGVNFKMVQFRVGCRGQCPDGGVTATTYAVDAGLQGIPLQSIPLRLGAMVAHLGPRLQVVNAAQADPLPTRLRVSGAYEVLNHFVPDRPLDLWVTLELEDRWRSLGSPSVYVGTEFAAGRTDMLLVRAGYVHGNVSQVAGAALGLGLRYQRFDVGIARSLADSGISGSEPVHITFGVVF